MLTVTLLTPASADVAEILSLIGSLHEAHHDRNATGIAAPHAPHAVIYD